MEAKSKSLNDLSQPCFLLNVYLYTTYLLQGHIIVFWIAFTGNVFLNQGEVEVDGWAHRAQNNKMPFLPLVTVNKG